MNHLHRELAPIDGSAWSMIEDEARRALQTYLAIRKVVDFSGPHGWKHAAENLGTTTELTLQLDGAAEAGDSTHSTAMRAVLPMIELRVEFKLSRAALDAVERGARSVDLAPVTKAARHLARLEDRIALYGVPQASVRGMLEASEHAAVAVSNDYRDFPGWVSAAEERLREAGVDGPYALLLDPSAHAALAKTTGAGGYPVLQHVRRLMNGPVVWAPALDGGLMASMRGGDFELVVGQDVSLGYVAHDENEACLYLEESVTFRLDGPEACVPLSIAQ